MKLKTLELLLKKQSLSIVLRSLLKIRLPTLLRLTGLM